MRYGLVTPLSISAFNAYLIDAGRHFFAKSDANYTRVWAKGLQLKVVWQAFDGANNVIKLVKPKVGGKS